MTRSPDPRDPAALERIARVALLCLAFGLTGMAVRGIFGSVPPLLDDIDADLRITSTEAGLLTTLAVLSIGVFAPLGQRAAVRLGAERTVLLCLLLIGGAGLARLVPWGLWWLFVATVVAGAAMGGASAVVPGLIKERVPRAQGITTGFFATGMSQGVTLCAAVAVPLAGVLGGWRPSLAATGSLALLAAIVWVLVLGGGRRRSEVPVLEVVTERGLPWGSRTARMVTLYYTSQLLVGFTCVAWIAPRFLSLGVSEQRAAAIFVTFQAIQAISMFGIPALADRLPDRRPVLLGAQLCVATGLTLLLAAPLAVPHVAVALAGLGVGAGTALGMTLVIDSTTSQEDAARLNAMALLVANVCGSAGPLLLGALRDRTGSFVPGLAVLLAVTLAMVPVVRVYRPGRTLRPTSRHEPATEGLLAPTTGPGGA